MSRIRTAALIALLLLGNAALHAQTWTPVQQFPGFISFVKFVDYHVGFVGLGVGPGGPLHGPVGIWRTSDGGDHWVECQIPANYAGEVTDLVMVDSLNGWSTVIPYNSIGNNGLWRTTDGGQTWSETGMIGACTAVRITPSAIVLTDIFGAGHISTDGGATFHNGFSSSSNCVDFVDDLHGVVSNYRGQQWQVTSDGGLTWTSSDENVESWSVYGVPGTSIFYAAPEGPTDGTPYMTEILRSTDYGHHWVVQTVMPFITTGHITGVGEHELYIQVSNNAGGNTDRRTGIFRSTDHGLTWTDLEGPGALSDSRFTAAGTCRGTIVFAFDPGGRGTLYRLGTPGSNLFFSSYYSGELPTPLKAQATVPLSVRLPLPLHAPNHVAHLIHYTVDFDNAIASFAGVVAPPGWKLESFKAISTGLDVTLTKTDRTALTDSLGLGSITFNGEERGESHVSIKDLHIEMDSENVNFCLTLEGNISAVVKVDEQSGVAPNEHSVGVPLRISNYELAIPTAIHEGSVEVQLIALTGEIIDTRTMNASTSLTYEPATALHGTYFVLLTQDGHSSVVKFSVP